MKSGAVVSWRLSVALLTSAVGLGAASAARADDVPVRRAVVLGDASEELLERVTGQTGDLAWTLERRDGVVPRRDALSEVRRVARAARAEVALWFEETEVAVTVFVVEVDAMRLFARRIDDAAEGEPMGRSARWEAAAVVVRGALRDLADGGHIGVVVRDSRPRAGARSVRARARFSGLPAGRHESARAPSTTRFGAWAGWAWGIDGHSPAGQHGPAATLALEHRWLRVELGFASSLGATLEDDRTTVRMTRHVFRGGIGGVLDVAEALSLSAALTGGLVAWSRATVEVADGVTASPVETHVTGTFGAAIRLAWLPVGRVLGIEPAIGLDVVPGAPVLGYREGDRIVERNRIWILSPWFGVGVTVRTGGAEHP